MKCIFGYTRYQDAWIVISHTNPTLTMPMVGQV